MSDEIILPFDHPYVGQGDATVSQNRSGWVVRWRDFASVKQEKIFTDLDQARSFADRVTGSQRIVDMEQIGGRFEDFENIWNEA